LKKSIPTTAAFVLAGLALAAPARLAPTPEMRRVLAQLGDYKAPPIPTLTPIQARMLPTPTNAAMEVLAKDGKPAVDTTVDVDHTTIPGPSGNKLVARIYRPQGVRGPLPVTVYFHGGGWVIADLNTYDPSCRAISKMANTMVVSVAYRLAPENKFPAAHEDAYAATQYIMKNAAKMGGDPRRVAIMGESAGGNMATATCLMAKDRKGMMPKAQVLVYPLTQVGMVTPSYRQQWNAKPLDVPMIKWFGKHYLRTPADGKNRYLNVLSNTPAQLRGLPPATVILAEIDPLRSEGEMYAQKLQKAGVRTNWRLYRGVTHEFFGMGALVPGAMEAEQYAANALKMAFGG
jgi:acetyl esterase/lipase